MRLIRRVPGNKILSIKGFSSPSRCCFSTASPADEALQGLKHRPPQIIPDYLYPMHSHLLTTTLSDLLHTSFASSPVIQSPSQPLPQGHHLVYFPIQLAPSTLADDGADPGHSPGEPYTRRVWAGGEVVFGRRWKDMRMDGREVVCKETITDAVFKGEGLRKKAFVDVCRQYGLGHTKVEERPEWEIQEVRRLVFMPPQQDIPESQASSPPKPPRVVKAPYPSSYSTTIVPSAAHLFHFSALSFNAHSIHVDPLFARADGHRDLLVHGPLTLALMLRVLGGQIRAREYVERLTYRNLAPLYVGEEMTICVRPVVEGRWDVWVQGPEGGMAVRGTAMLAMDEH